MWLKFPNVILRSVGTDGDGSIRGYVETVASEGVEGTMAIIHHALGLFDGAIV